MPIANDITSLVGQTPLVRLNRLPKAFGCKAELLAKLESFNPTASVKDRIAGAMVLSAEEEGVISANKTVLIEPTSGNTGISFAALGAFLGHPVQIYMPDWVSSERKRLLKFYGAKLFEITANQGGFTKCIELAAKKSKKKD